MLDYFLFPSAEELDMFGLVFCLLGDAARQHKVLLNL